MSKLTDQQKANVVATYEMAKVISDKYEDLVATVENLADELNVSLNTVRGVIVAEGIYVSKPKAAKTGSASNQKAQIVAALQAVTGKEMPSFVNASKKDLETLWAWVVSTSDRKEANNG